MSEKPGESTPNTEGERRTAVSNLDRLVAEITHGSVESSWLPDIMGAHFLLMRDNIATNDLGGCVRHENALHGRVESARTSQRFPQELDEWDETLAGLRLLAVQRFGPQDMAMAQARLINSIVKETEGLDNYSLRGAMQAFVNLPNVSPAEWIDQWVPPRRKAVAWVYYHQAVSGNLATPNSLPVGSPESRARIEQVVRDAVNQRLGEPMLHWVARQLINTLPETAATTVSSDAVFTPASNLVDYLLTWAETNLGALVMSQGRCTNFYLLGQDILANDRFATVYGQRVFKLLDSAYEALPTAVSRDLLIAHAHFERLYAYRYYDVDELATLCDAENARLYSELMSDLLREDFTLRYLRSDQAPYAATLINGMKGDITWMRAVRHFAQLAPFNLDLLKRTDDSGNKILRGQVCEALELSSPLSEEPDAANSIIESLAGPGSPLYRVGAEVDNGDFIAERLLNVWIGNPGRGVALFNALVRGCPYEYVVAKVCQVAIAQGYEPAIAEWRRKGAEHPPIDRIVLETQLLQTLSSNKNRRG